MEGKILTPYGRRTWLPLGVVLLGATVAGWLYLLWAGVVCGLAFCFVLWFFRDPERRVKAAESALIAPADGKVVEIAEAKEIHYIHGRARKVAIFMSLTDVHVNRSPCESRVEWVRHRPGRFLNALGPKASIENECTMVALRDGKKRQVLLKLVAGFIARRIVCPLRPGDSLQRGQRLGMITFGSRVETFVSAREDFRVLVQLGQRVRAGVTVLGKWL